MAIKYPQSLIRLDANIPTRLVNKERAKLWTEKLDSISRGVSEKLRKDAETFIIKNEWDLAHLHTDVKEPLIRLAKIYQDLFPSSINKKQPIKVEFDTSTQAEYDLLFKRHERLQEQWRSAYEEVKPKYAEAYEVFESLRILYAQFLYEHRIDPDSMENPHPRNIRVLASVTQTSGSNTPNTQIGKTISPHPALISRLLACTTSMDEMIARAEQEVLLSTPYTNTFPYKEPHIQKPISTPCRENNTAWRKIDNNNPNIRRIVLLIPTEENYYNDINAIVKNYSVSSQKEFDSTLNANTYRVDKIILVSPPSFEETLNGLTHAEKIKKTFRELEACIKREKESNPNLSFEGIAHWHGHGTWLKNDSPSLEDDRMFLEGSREFLFLTDNCNNGISEAEIKELERSDLSNFTYFIHEVGSCHSGALIA